ncbi:MAG: S41 family peptidase [Candidatus Dormibacteria bacterium]
MWASLAHRWQILVAALLVVVIAGIVAITVGLSRSTPQSVREIASLADILTTKDPVLHQPTQRTQFDHLAAGLEATARSDPGAPYWLVWEWLNKLTLYLKSPHTTVYFFPDSPEVYPLAFTWAANGLAVSWYPAGHPAFPAYSQVVQLGAVPAGDLLGRLTTVVAGNSYWVRTLGAFQMSFPYLLHWTGVIGSSNGLRLTVKEPSGRVKTVSVQPLALAHPGSASQWTVTRPAPSAHPGSIVRWLSSQFPDLARSSPTWYIDSPQGYGVLHIYTMTLNDALTSDLQDFFTIVEKDGLHRVLLDVRGDPGGNDCVINAVLAYLPNPTSVSVSGCGPASAPPTGLVFHGKVFVAQGWGTASSAVDFAEALSQVPETTVVGVPTGGSPSGDLGNVMAFKVAASSPVLVGQTGTQQVCFPWRLPGAQRSPIQGGCPLIPTFNPKVFIFTTMRDLRDHIDPVIQWLNSQP